MTEDILDYLRRKSRELYKNGDVAPSDIVDDAVDEIAQLRTDNAALRARVEELEKENRELKYNVFATMCGNAHKPIGYDDYDDEECPLCAALKRVAELEAAGKQTHVKESLPEEYQRVLVFWDSGHSDVAKRIGSFWVNDNWHRDLLITSCDITHWQPLPVAPKGGEA